MRTTRLGGVDDEVGSPVGRSPGCARSACNPETEVIIDLSR
ncbi:hypothetical protein AB0B89_23425 [Sphaerisporangium sp. NPDC049002]